MSLKFDSTSNQNFWISNEHDKKRMLQYQLMEELNKVSQKTCKSFETNDLIESEKMKNQSASSSLEVNLTKRGSLQLWQFLLHLLTTTGHETIIEWSKKSSAEFKLLDPEEVARLWGIQKNRPTMNYDKLSRSLRYYYEKGIMQKVSGERYVYKFINHQDIYQLNPDLNELHNLKNQNEKQNGHKIKFNQVQKLVVNQTNSALKSTSSKLKTISSNKNGTTLKQRYQPYSRSCSINQQNPISINNLSYEINNTNNYIIQNPTLLGYEQHDNSMVYQNQNFYSSYPYQSLNKNNIKQEYSTQNCDQTNSPSLLSSKFSANSSGFSSFSNNSLNSNSYQSMSTNLESPKQTTNQTSLTSTPNCYNYYKSQQNAHYNYNQQLNNYDDCINSYNQSIMSPAYYSNTNRSNSNEKFTNYFQSNQMSSPIISNGYFNEIEYDKSFKQSIDYNNSSYSIYDNNYNYNSNSTNLITTDCYSSNFLDSSNVNKLTSPLSISPSSVSSNSCVSSTSNSNSIRYSYNNENEQSPANYF